MGAIVSRSGRIRPSFERESQSRSSSNHRRGLSNHDAPLPESLELGRERHEQQKQPGEHDISGIELGGTRRGNEPIWTTEELLGATARVLPTSLTASASSKRPTCLETTDEGASRAVPSSTTSSRSRSTHPRGALGSPQFFLKPLPPSRNSSPTKGGRFRLSLPSSPTWTRRSSSGQGFGENGLPLSPLLVPQRDTTGSIANRHCNGSQSNLARHISFGMLKSIDIDPRDEVRMSSSTGPQEMELSNLGSSDQSSVQIRTIGSIVRWQRGNMIGAGSYGKVYMGMNSDTGELFVIKQVVFHAQGVGGVPNEGKSGNGEDVLQLEQEIALLATLQHEHIVQYFGTERNYVTNELSIFLEHMPGGSIADIVLKFGPLQEAVVKKYTREVLQGLKYLHGKGIIHRDIKGQNILVDNKGVCKLADFGASRYLQTADSAANMSFKGTPVFMSPEVIMEQRYSRKSDIWSVGCTVVQMATGNPPFSEFSNHIAALFHITSTTEPPPVPANISAEARDFVLKCFERDLSKRPFVDALLRHSFIERGASGGGSPLTATTPSSSAHAASRSQWQDLDLVDEERYKKFKEEQLSRVKVKAHVRKTPSQVRLLNRRWARRSSIESQTSSSGNSGNSGTFSKGLPMSSFDVTPRDPLTTRSPSESDRGSDLTIMSSLSSSSSSTATSSSRSSSASLLKNAPDILPLFGRGKNVSSQAGQGAGVGFDLESGITNVVGPILAPVLPILSKTRQSGPGRRVS